MAKDDSEEAVFDPSAQRLSQLRQSGQVPRSPDFGSTVMLIVVLGYVIVTWDITLERFRIAFRDAPIFAPTDFWDRAGQTTVMMGQLALETVLPLLAIVFVVAFLVTILDGGGFIFTLQPLMPNFAKFNPAEGIKNMFTLQNLIELLKSLFKLAVFLVCCDLIVRRFLNDAFWAPSCGIPCVMEVGLTMGTWIVAIGIAILLLSALADLFISRWLFKRNNRMTLTEMKREMKENFGDPHVRAARKQERKRLAESAALTGPGSANLWIVGRDAIVGIAYKPDVSGVPFVAAKGGGERIAEFLARAREKNVHTMQNPDLVALLMEKGKVGQPIPKESFGGVANGLVQAGFT